MLRSTVVLGCLAGGAALSLAALQLPSAVDEPAATEHVVQPVAAHDRQPEQDALGAIAKGRQTFRHDTFGDEAFWGDTLDLDDAIAGAANGGVGPGLSPRTALSLGLKV